MIGTIQTGTLASAKISAVIHKGLSVKTPDDKAARQAIIDAGGNVVDAGDAVAKEASLASIASYKNLLKGMGHLRVANHDPATKV